MDMCGMQLVVSLTFKSTANLLFFLTRLAGTIDIIVIVITYERDERSAVTIVLMDMWYSIGCFTYLQRQEKRQEKRQERHHLRERRTSICYYCVDGHVRYAIGCFTYL